MANFGFDDLDDLLEGLNDQLADLDSVYSLILYFYFVILIIFFDF